MSPAPKRVTRAAEALAASLDSAFLRALSEPVRVDIIKHLLVHGESDIAAIAASVAPDRSVVSRHLKLMLDARLLRVRKEGRHRFYDCNAAAFITQLEEILARTRALVTLCCPDQLG
jgi:DNA-binding transcriptional ArsR family regulator